MVNTRSRSNHDFSRYENPNTALAEFFKRMDSNLEEIVHSFKGEQLDIDNFLSEQGVTGQISLADQVRTPFKITDVFAVWNAAAFPAPSVRNNFAATSNGGVLLPVGASITGFDLIIEPGVAQAFTTVTVSAIAGSGGNILTYDVSSPAAGAETIFQIRYPQPISPATPTSQISVTFNGTANTGSGNLIAYGTGPSSVVIQIGQRFFYPNPTAGQFQLTGLTNGLQVLMRDVVSFQVTPPVACMFETIGTADYRKVDRQ